MLTLGWQAALGAVMDESRAGDSSMASPIVLAAVRDLLGSTTVQQVTCHVIDSHWHAGNTSSEFPVAISKIFSRQGLLESGSKLFSAELFAAVDSHCTDMELQRV